MDSTLKIEVIVISAARTQLTKIPARIDGKATVLKVTSKNNPVLALMSWELFDSIIETLEILADNELMHMLAKSEQQAKDGETLSWDKAKEILS
jgi:PHD/YefM family antitoxin component YafN of YafNO toxin-antitoxin module